MRQYIAALTAATLFFCGVMAPPVVLAQQAARGAQAHAPHPPVAVKTAPNTVPAPNPDEQALRLFKPVTELANEWLKRPELYHSLVGLEIMDVPSGRVLFSSNGNKRFVTASIAKVLTTACAYDTFGPDYRYRTSLHGFGDIRNARLGGNLLIVPSQDPSFERKDMNELLKGLKTKGILYINGRVFMQPVAGGGDHFPTEWLIQDWGQDWMPVSSDLVIDRNILLGDAGGGYPLTFGGSPSETSALTHSLLKAPWGPAWAVFNKGVVTLYRPDIPVNGGIVIGNPDEYNTAVFKMALQNLGIKVDGHEMGAGASVPLGEHVSEPMSEIIRFCLKRSDNLYAQQLLRTLGSLAPLSRNLEKASLEDRGLARMHTWLASAGVPSDEVVIWDGCGLSRKNAITPHALNLVLRHMAGPSGNGPYLDLMLHGDSGPGQTWRYKTGAMDSVRSISGIVRTSTGQPLAVTAIINDHQPKVGELRGSLANLIGRLESLGGLKLTPVAAQARTKAAGRVVNKGAKVRSTGRTPAATPVHHRRHRH
jgi:D-alanyl-D-alanine carboxypeptidase/D-alanyl-D-alanine-endopeptidase (penicillin-binding protein 4)